MGGTPLHWAALEKHSDVVTFLASNGADVKAKDKVSIIIITTTTTIIIIIITTIIIIVVYNAIIL